MTAPREIRPRRNERITPVAGSPRSVALLALIALVASACSTAGTVGPSAGPFTRTSTPPVAASSGAALEPWRTAVMRDVRSGETFALADLAGKLVVIEPMAIWCASCAHQQREVSKALTAIGSDVIVYISLDVDPTEAESDLAAYADERGFEWRFVVASRDLSRGLVAAFGDQVLSPPSTPRIIVTPDGQVVGPDFGIADADEVAADLRAHLP